MGYRKENISENFTEQITRSMWHENAIRYMKRHIYVLWL